MTERFELFTTSVTRAYKSVQQIKKHQSLTFGVKGIHVMCLYFLWQNPDGLTVTELSTLCCEDKAAISRTIDSLLESGHVTYSEPENKRRWRSKLFITEKGLEAAEKMSYLISDIVCTAKKGLTPEELNCFYKVFTVINNNLSEYCKYLETRKNP